MLPVAGAHNRHARIDIGSVAHAFAPAVAELALGLTQAATRGIIRNDRDFRIAGGLWLHAGTVGYNTLFGKAVGCVGGGGLSVY